MSGATTAAAGALDARAEPGRALAALLALAVHAVFIALLVFGFRLQKPDSAPVIAELWSSLPPLPVAERPVPEPKVAPPPSPPPPRPTPRAEPAGPEAVKPPAKADLELKERVGRERAAAEKAAKEKAEADATRKAVEQRRREEDRLREALAKAEQAKAAEAARAQREQEELQRKAADAAAAAQRRQLAEFTDRIRARVRQFIVLPPDVPATARAEFLVTLIPGGQVLQVKLLRSSGHALYDEAVERAIRRADPLPVPADVREFPPFRELRLQFTPQE